MRLIIMRHMVSSSLYGMRNRVVIGSHSSWREVENPREVRELQEQGKVISGNIRKNVSGGVNFVNFASFWLAETIFENISISVRFLFFLNFDYPYYIFLRS